MSQTPTAESRLALTDEEASLYSQIDKQNLPKHIAIIMDGNGRWAKKRDFSRIKGHKSAIPAVRQTVEGCVDLGIEHLTLYAFSTENWKRPPQETGTLMALLRQFLRLELKAVRKHSLRVKVIGAIHELSPGIQKDLKTVFDGCSKNTGMCFNIAINYSGRMDILHGFKTAMAAGVDPESLTEQSFKPFLSTAGQPDPDLVIRTSGEMRISNFLLWQIAYSEIWVTPTLWPDFRRGDLYRAVLDYQARHRRFGGI
ncbi:polyprenyl diphosphate synthase [Sulfidibacter corallicola]|uniref:Isoprenyl transferase n=1 Tax=Sulfidibacter corallicola TaxID=2818388 RepID=A0A8A4TIQ0_SULCO|nr:polyprenyl diphosphate synthase [Sulfidibacter corallicola]QTD49909.1 di-trans,poly-cis-decaprenylcistransferase [Sulfidibacter corallicola]